MQKQEVLILAYEGELSSWSSDMVLDEGVDGSIQRSALMLMGCSWLTAPLTRSSHLKVAADIVVSQSNPTKEAHFDGSP